jgi:UrcA family protein
MNTPMAPSISITVLALAWCAAGVSVPAGAARPTRPTLSDLPSVTVHFAELNLLSPEGVKALYGRIKSAARDVCGTSFSLWDGHRPFTMQACYRETIDHAVRDVNLPKLTALHDLSTSKPEGRRSLRADNR